MIQWSIADKDNPSDRKTLRRAEAMAKNLGTKFARGEPVAPFCLWYTKLTSWSEVVPSKAFLEDQADRDQAERDRAEKERAKRELDKRQKHLSYEDFEPISISELDCIFLFFYMVILTRFSAIVTASKCQIEELRERGIPEDMLSNIQESMIMYHLIHIGSSH
jgi:hypothetical protein